MNPRDKKNLIQTAVGVITTAAIALTITACGGSAGYDEPNTPTYSPQPNPARTGWVDLDGVKFRCNGNDGVYKGTTSDGATVDIEINYNDRRCFQ
jgi:hypothetical protein